MSSGIQKITMKQPASKVRVVLMCGWNGICIGCRMFLCFYVMYSGCVDEALLGSGTI